MKIRNGFVSNSSSSSFMLIGKNINIIDITDKDILEKTYVCIGKELGDGDDIFFIDSIEILWFLKSFQMLPLDNDRVIFDLPVFDGFIVFETFKHTIIEDEELKFNSKDIPNDDIIVDNYWKDYSSSKNVDDLYDKYIPDNYLSKFNNVYNKFKRKQKLDKIGEK